MAVLAGMMSIAVSIGALAFTERYSLTPLNQGLVRLDGWTGEVVQCLPRMLPTTPRRVSHLVCERGHLTPKEWLEMKRRQGQ